MIWGILEIIVSLGVTAWIPFQVEKFFVANLIPLPSWPYGLSLALFAFLFTKTIFVFFRSLIMGFPFADRRAKTS